ncbi:methyltransferase domain-containing protein [Piscinibacter sakaiensis]|uniref:methyltransferase domain-containing protein n=1 Tax=Piscinibacter sakaiensis TaxID=1547922 RepID=UPI00372A5020
MPTPDAAVERMLQMGEVGPADRLVDLGSGDGKIVIAAALGRGARALGLEFNPQLVALSRQRARAAGLTEERARFREADIFATDFSDATVVTMYLLPQLNLRLRPTLFAMAPGTRVVSHSFDMGEWLPDEQGRAGLAQLYRWTVPANASGAWALEAPGLGLPATTFELRQRFQRVDGEARVDDGSAGLVDARLDGDRLRFAWRAPDGRAIHFDGRVAGDRWQRLSSAGAAAGPVRLR